MDRRTPAFRIRNCQSLTDLKRLKRQQPLTEENRRSVFEKRQEIFQHISRWLIENEVFFPASNYRTPEQSERFLH